MNASTDGNDKKKIGRVNALYGFVVSRLDPEVIKQSLATEGITPDPDATDERLAVVLFESLQAAHKSDEFLECDHCLARSPEGLSSCPFCGDDGEEEASPIAGGKKVDVAGEAKSEQSDVPAPAKADDAKPTNEKKDEAHMATMEKAGKAKAKKEPKANGKAANGHAEASSPRGDEAPPAAMVPAVKGSVVTVKTLDKAVAEVVRLKSEISVNGHALGLELHKINEQQLWKLRPGKGGKGSAYAGFEGFVYEECGFTPQTAYRLIDTSKNFTADDVAKFGTRKLSIAITAPKEDQPKIIAQIKAGASKAAIEKEVSKIKAEKGHKRPSGKGRKYETHATGNPKKAAAAAEKITIASMVGRKTVKLFKKPEKFSKGLDWTTLKRASKLGDHPVGRLEMENDVVMFFSLQADASGDLILVTETHREAAK